MKIASIGALQIEACAPQLHLQRLYMAAKYIWKFRRQNEDHLLKKISYLSLLNLMEKYWVKKELPLLDESDLRMYMTTVCISHYMETDFFIY